MARQSKLRAEEEAILKRVVSLGELELLKQRRMQRRRLGLVEDAYDDGEIIPPGQRGDGAVVSQEKVLLALGIQADSEQAPVLYRAVLCGSMAGACLESGVPYERVEEWRQTDPTFSRREQVAVGELHQGYLRLALSEAGSDGSSRRERVTALVQMAQAAMPEEFRGRKAVDRKRRSRLDDAFDRAGV